MPTPLVLDPEGLRLTFKGVEILRQLDCPIRDASWRTLPTAALATTHTPRPDGATLDRRFRTTDGSIDGHLHVEAGTTDETATVTATVTLTALTDTIVNRAGFVLLHPIAGVAGTALTVRHGDGRTEETAFPSRISPGQPVFDIAGLRHTISGIAVDIAMEGETFEMEDQRNWTDASFKTYCRPLSLPRPYPMAAGETARQTLRITLSGTPAHPASGTAANSVTVRMPDILLAHDPALAPQPAPDLSALGTSGLILRVDARAPDLTRPTDAPVTLEIVADTPRDVATVATACAAAGLAPRRVIALPRSYLASVQPEGPWPHPTPADFLPAVRAAFPAAEAGGGVLTNFTELNRCRPDPDAIDFATFGTTAIVHAADDRSVRETLEALPAIFDSARSLAAGRPLHLGLVAIGMRSNPYGAATAPNPDRARTPMAMDDPRQSTRFAGAFAIGAVAAAARAGIASLAPAMAAGPLGLGGAGEPLWPLAEAVAALTALAGRTVDIAGAPGGLLTIRTATTTLAANLGAIPVSLAGTDLAPMDFISVPA